VHSRPDPAASVIKKADAASVGPSDHSGKPRPLARLAEFLQVIKLEDCLAHADSSSGAERAHFIEALRQSLLKRIEAIRRCLRLCASVEIKQRRLGITIYPPAKREKESDREASTQVGTSMWGGQIVDPRIVGDTQITHKGEDRPLSAPMLPRIVGFDVPQLHEHVDSSVDEAIIALLDLAPGARWTELFVMKCEALASQLSLAEVRVEGSRIYFYGSISDSRALADAVMSIVHVLNDQLMREDNDAASREDNS